jgi:DNA-directed RNA polymerase specialized sigma24 family protein
MTVEHTAPAVRPPDVLLTDVSDDDLIIEAVAGDDRAFQELFRRHAFPAWRLALVVAGATGAAHDAVADAFTWVLARSWETCSLPVSFRQAVVSATRLTAMGPGEGHGPPEPAEIEVGGTEGAMLAAFASLPERSRSALWLTVAEGGTAAQAAGLLGMPVEGAEMLLAQAVATLHRRFLDGQMAEAGRGPCRATLDRLAAGSVDLDMSHVGTCDACQDRIGALLHVGQVVQRLATPLPAELGDDAARRWRAWREAGAGRRPRVLPVWAERAMGAAAAGVVGIAMVGALLFGVGGRDHRPESAAPPAVAGGATGEQALGGLLPPAAGGDVAVAGARASGEKAASVAALDLGQPSSSAGGSAAKSSSTARGPQRPPDLSPPRVPILDPPAAPPIGGPPIGGPSTVIPPVLGPPVAIPPVVEVPPAAVPPLDEIVSPVTEPIADVVEPVTEIVTPVVEPVTEIVAPVVEPVSEIVAPVVAPVVEAVAPVVEPVAQAVAPVVAPVVEAVAPVVEPVAQAVAPVVAPVVEAVAPVAEPVAQAVAPVAAPVAEAVAPVVAPVAAPVAEAVAPVTGSIIAPGG